MEVRKAHVGDCLDHRDKYFEGPDGLILTTVSNIERSSMLSMLETVVNMGRRDP